MSEKIYSEEDFMREALEQAKLAYQLEETPIGAIVVREGEIVGRGFNRRETGKNALYHAEILAINEACQRLGGWRLWQCELYVTLEPCPMCAGAIIHSRLKKVIFGAYDKKGGACASVTNLFDMPFNHKPAVTGGILEEECSALIKQFFKELREKKKAETKSESKMELI